MNYNCAECVHFKRFCGKIRLILYADEIKYRMSSLTHTPKKRKSKREETIDIQIQIHILHYISTIDAWQFYRISLPADAIDTNRKQKRQ